ncbi:MAG TPA: twin-arginine translocase TatA/TatE family subunit [Candidatus Goldiibacteriota bacterium]|nr:twin-arginine translocase TatA/TatE family subunit [Candidatus Goldiibacteriota bacterium]
MGLHAGEIILIIAVVLLLFGASKLPELGRSIGKALSEFKKGLKEGAEDADTGKESGSQAKTGKSKKKARK